MRAMTRSPQSPLSESQEITSWSYIPAPFTARPRPERSARFGMIPALTTKMIDEKNGKSQNRKIENREKKKLKSHNSE